MLTLEITRYLLVCSLFLVSTSGESLQNVIPADIRAYVENYVHAVVRDIEQKHRDEILTMKQSFDTELLAIKDAAAITEETLKREMDDIKTELREQTERLTKSEFECEKRNIKIVTSESLRDKTGYLSVNNMEPRRMEWKQDKRQYTSGSKRYMKRQSEPETKVAFFATLSSYIGHLGANQDIPFDHVVTNIGNGFNGHHGTFIAPVGGIYVFSVTLYGGNTYGHVVVSGSVVAKLEVLHSDWQQASQTVIVSLRKGDDVSIQNTDVDQSIGGDHYSTFSGFLLYENLASNIVG